MITSEQIVVNPDSRQTPTANNVLAINSFQNVSLTYW